MNGISIFQLTAQHRLAADGRGTSPNVINRNGFPFGIRRLFFSLTVDTKRMANIWRAFPLPSATAVDKNH